MSRNQRRIEIYNALLNVQDKKLPEDIAKKISKVEETFLDEDKMRVYERLSDRYSDEEIIKMLRWFRSFPDQLRDEQTFFAEADVLMTREEQYRQRVVERFKRTKLFTDELRDIFKGYSDKDLRRIRLPNFDRFNIGKNPQDAYEEYLDLAENRRDMDKYLIDKINDLELKSEYVEDEIRKDVMRGITRGRGEDVMRGLQRSTPITKEELDERINNRMGELESMTERGRELYEKKFIDDKVIEMLNTAFRS
jgi:hypothetical protein